jgi:hypothetical protein
VYGVIDEFVLQMLLVIIVDEKVLKFGWSEPSVTNALVADEPIEAVFRMNENPILPARIYIFFHLFSTPKFSPLLPTTYLSPPTYHLPPPSYLPPTNPSPPSLHRQSSRNIE